MDSWELFEQDFKEGDEVIIVNDSDLLDFGKLSYDDKGFTLSSRFRPNQSYDWKQCTFMAKEGFPVKKIFGKFPRGVDIINKQVVLRAAFAMQRADMLRSQVELLDQVAKSRKGLWAIENVRDILTEEIQELKKEARLALRETGQRELEKVDVSGVRFGCPFETGSVSITVYNVSGYGREYDLTPGEETLRMVDQNGLPAQLWQLTSIFDYA